jgi:hypothetical protein
MIWEPHSGLALACLWAGEPLISIKKDPNLKTMDIQTHAYIIVF